MPVSSSIEEMLSRVEGIAAQFGEQATELSKLLEALQNRLRALPGKRRIEVTDKDLTLRFDGDKRGEWSLFMTGEDYAGPVSSAPVLKKATAFRLLPQLFAAVEKDQQSQLDELRSALDNDRLAAAGVAVHKKEGR